MSNSMKRKAEDISESGNLKISRVSSMKTSAVPNSPRQSSKMESVPYVRLTTHAGLSGIEPVEVNWGEIDSNVRGPIIATNMHDGRRNAIGAHGGSYCIYRALAVANKTLDSEFKPRLTNTTPVAKIGPFPSWGDPQKICSLDPFGHDCVNAFSEYYDKGYDIRPTIAVTLAHMDMPEIKDALSTGHLKADGTILKESGQIHVLKAAIEPVWYLPGIAERFNCTEAELRRALFQQTNGMYPELMTRGDINVFLPPIGGMTVYIFGDKDTIQDPDKPLAVRVHDECNGSDVFGSDICTCRPYLIHGIEVCIQAAQEGGCGIIVYFRKEGRALGEVTKYLVYNVRKRQEGGDCAANYFSCTETVAGVEDVRFQSLMPDALHWLGVTKIDRLVSMSDMKYDAIVSSGIKVVERIPIRPDLVPADAQVELDAKVAAGYDGGKVYEVKNEEALKEAKGRIYGK